MEKQRIVLLKIIKPKEKIAEAGSMGLYKTTYKFSQLSPDGASTSVSHIAKLNGSSKSNAINPMPFIQELTVKEAHEKYSMSKLKLRELCRNQVVSSEKRRGVWYLSEKSLLDWLAR